MASSPRINQDSGPYAFLSLLVSYLPEGEEYTVDAGRWASAIHNLRDRYADSHPEIFRGLRFVAVPMANDYSPEVSEFLTFLQFGEITDVSNPGYVRMRIQEGAQRNLRVRYGPAFVDVSDVIEQMAAEVTEDLLAH